MMKKFLSGILALTISITAFGLTSCVEPTPSHSHTFGEWTKMNGNSSCEESTFQRTCTQCSETEERKGTYSDHAWSYLYDVTQHWTVCGLCSFTTEKKNHTLTAEHVCRDCKNPIPTECVTYEVSTDGTYAIVTGYDEKETDSVVISPLYNGLPVKEIKASAFEGCADLTSVTLPLGITTVGEKAFYGCASLMGIYLRKSVTKVGANAFFGCLDLKIFCEAESAPEGFDEEWNAGCRSPRWNYTGEAMTPISLAATPILESPIWQAEAPKNQVVKNDDLNGMRAPEGFSSIHRFDGKAEGVGAWERSALWNYNFDNTNLRDYSDVWFAIKVVNGFWAFVNDTPGLDTPWLYIHLRQVGIDDKANLLWDIQGSVGGQVWIDIKNQSGSRIDEARGANSIPRLLWDDAFNSPDKNAILIYHRTDNTTTYAPPTIYCTEVRALPKYN